MTSVCNNHTCGKKVNLSKEYHTCSLCKSPVYCSSDCQLIDWPLHSCANTFQVGAPSTLVAVPYFYEDLLTERDLENVHTSDPINAAYSVMYVNTNRDVSQYIIEPVAQNAVSDDGRGIRPPGKSYELEIKYGNAAAVTKVKGSAQNDAIYRGNANNNVANELAGRTGPAEEDAVYVYWTKSAKVAPVAGPLGVRVPFSIKWTADTGNSLKFDGYVPITATAPATKANRRVQQHLQSKLETKFKSTARGAQVFRCTDPVGNSAILTLSADQRTLLDVEVVVRKDPLEPVAATPCPRFLCNTRDVSDVVGLVMALEKVSADTRGKNARVEQVIGPVRNYAQAVVDEVPRQVPSAVSAAVVNAVDIMFAQVGEPARVSEYVSKIVRGGPDAARQLALALTADIIKTRDSSVLRDYRVGRVSRQVDDLMLAVLQMRNAIEQSCSDSPDIKIYDEVIAILQRAKNPLQRSV